MVNETYCFKTVYHIEDYLNAVKEYKKANHPNELWYRGHRNNMWNLQPNLYREAVMDLEPGEGIQELKFMFPDFMKEIKEFRKQIVDKKPIDISSLNNFQIIFLAQHYGLLTPVLDWTTDPLVALFFAIDKYTYRKEEFPVVYFFDPCLCNKYSYICGKDGSDISTPICIDYYQKCFDDWMEGLSDNNCPIQGIPVAMYSDVDYSYRICRQSGKFTFHGPLHPLNYEWNDIKLEGRRLTEVVKIAPEAVDRIKEELMLLNIDNKTIYRESSSPLDNICEQIKKEASVELKEYIEKRNERLGKIC